MAKRKVFCSDVKKHILFFLKKSKVFFTAYEYYGTKLLQIVEKFLQHNINFCPFRYHYKKCWYSPRGYSSSYCSHVANVPCVLNPRGKLRRENIWPRVITRGHMAACKRSMWLCGHVY
jgi:hypothetical protein